MKDELDAEDNSEGRSGIERFQEAVRIVGENLWKAEQLGRFSRNRIYSLSEYQKLQQGIWPGRKPGSTDWTQAEFESNLSEALARLKTVTRPALAMMLGINVKTLDKYLQRSYPGIRMRDVKAAKARGMSVAEFYQKITA